MNEKVIIIDFGSQFTQLIARKIREVGIFSEVINFNDSLLISKLQGTKAIIFSGSPASVNDEEPYVISKQIFELSIPILAICYGMQLITRELGGQVQMSKAREYGRSFIEIVKESPLLDNIASIGDKKEVWMSHGDKVTSLPQGFSTIAKTKDSPFAIIANEEKNIYALQFHPEVAHTTIGVSLLKNFLIKIANIKPSWSMSNFKDMAIARVRQQVGNNKVICALSGGVDSAVAALLVHKAIGDNLTCIFINNGLLRKNEAEQVRKTFSESFKINLIYKDEVELFLNRLEGISDPEQKRKIIGKGFIDIFSEEARKRGDIKFLVQGTIYPDVIESSHPSGGGSHTIKSHHNVGGLPKDMNLELVEPLRELFKDEVRKLGLELGLPKNIINRHPFPGPGLAIRIIGEIDREKINILQEADSIFIEELHANNLYSEIWQAFCVLLPVKTVGVMGDGRTYEYVLSLRAVCSSDGMTADFYQFDMNFLSMVSNRIVNEVKGINRIVYDITSKPPATIEWE